MIYYKKSLINDIVIYLVIVYFPVLFASCGDKDEPNNVIVPTEDVYIVKFSGDCDKFTSYLSVSTVYSRSYLKSTSFENQNNKSCSDSQVKETYDLTLMSYDKSREGCVGIHCVGLCLSQQNYTMKCNIYRMKMDGTIVEYEREFKSFNRDYHPTSEEYSFNIVI